MVSQSGTPAFTHFEGLTSSASDDSSLHLESWSQGGQCGSGLTWTYQCIYPSLASGHLPSLQLCPEHISIPNISDSVAHPRTARRIQYLIWDPSSGVLLSKSQFHFLCLCCLRYAPRVSHNFQGKKKVELLEWPQVKIVFIKYFSYMGPLLKVLLTVSEPA